LRTLLALLLFFPTLALADECCFKGPGQCAPINSDSEKQACEQLPFFIIVDSSCKEAPECILSEEEPVQGSEKPVQKPKNQ